MAKSRKKEEVIGKDMKSGIYDDELGMGKAIERRDFLQGAAVTLAAAVGGLVPDLAFGAGVGAGPGAGVDAGVDAISAAQDRPGYYPPTRTGMRGSHPGSFEGAHAIRDASASLAEAEDTGEHFDLIVVGGGISGLAAAHFYRQAAGPDAKILILDNHDDFGGHAKRNEFQVDDKLLIASGGTALISSPTPYSPVADGLLKQLGIHPEKLTKDTYDKDRDQKFNLGAGVFFDKETFGEDKLVPRAGGYHPSAEDTAKFLAEAPLSAAARKDILAIETSPKDYMAGLSADEKKDRLSRMSYADYLLKVVQANPAVIPFYQHATDLYWGCGIDAISALDCWGIGLPGFDGLELPPTATARMGYTPGKQVETGGSYTYTFPDGNASIARLLVRDLIPAAVPGSTVEDSIGAPTDYAKLDQSGKPVRIRLSSTAAHVMNTDDGNVQVTYLRGDKPYRVKGKQSVLACWNMMIPFLCPELPQPQKDALRSLIKTPLVITSVALTNWRAFANLGVGYIQCPGGYHVTIQLVQSMDIGDYHSAKSPDEPIMIQMIRTPAQPGLSERKQHIAGRNELLATPFSTFEREIRSQLNRALGAGGFDASRDIAGIAVNRWPHGYAPEYNALVDPDEGLPLLTARARRGQIAIANSDSGGGAYTDIAIDQAHRAVTELLEPQGA
ncbi:MAG: NAD(P)/FAD-dependent oxidoreductase [Myxococcota bacterium]|nr:NAD(P)/FAD-dependent oxidoreductase [Myxococcota bacterium]